MRRTPPRVREAGSLTTTSPPLVKPTTTTRWPLLALIGAPLSAPRPKVIEVTTGIPALTICSTPRRDANRVTNACPVHRAA